MISGGNERRKREQEIHIREFPDILVR